MRLIDASELQKRIHEHDYLLKDTFNSIDSGMFTIGIDYAIQTAPTIDAVPVVRCWECRYHEDGAQAGEPWWFWCHWWNRDTDKTGYCHMGQHREDGDV